MVDCLKSRKSIHAMATFTVLYLIVSSFCHPAQSAIIINEIYTGAPDWIEIYNSGQTSVDVTGWKIRSWVRAVNSYQFEHSSTIIPENTILQPGEFLVVSDDPVSDCSIPASPAFMWCSMESLAVSLETFEGVTSDMVIAIGAFGEPDLEAIPHLITPPFPLRRNTDLIHRRNAIDTNSGSDWECIGEPSPCEPNAGQDIKKTASFQCTSTYASLQSVAASDADRSVAHESFRTEHVIILVIDGLRYQDAFFADTEDHLPNINGSLRAEGTFFTDFYNHGITGTTAGHTAMLTGVYQPTRNNEPDRANVFMLNPSIFEYYIKMREQQGIPIETARQTAWQIYGKRRECGTMAASIHPQYGDKYRSNILFPDSQDYAHQDMRAFDAMMETFDNEHPDIMLVNLAQVDEQGHLGTWEDYEYSFRKADEIVESIWRKIQSDEDYRDKTTLMVLTDHGRNDDDHGGHRHHGCPCKGCRRSFLLMMGPDTPKNITCDTEYSLIDVCSSVGGIFGFQPIFSDGRFIKDGFFNSLTPAACLADETSLSRSPEASRLPAVTSRGLNVCAGWIENSDTNTIRLIYSDDGGHTWPMITDFPWIETTQTVRSFDLAFGHDGTLWGLVMTSEMPSLKETPAEWFVSLVNLDTRHEMERHNVGKIGTRSGLTLQNTSLFYPWSFYIPKGDAPYFAEDEIRFSTFDPGSGQTGLNSVADYQNKCGYPDCAVMGDDRHLVFLHFMDYDWHLTYSRSTDAGQTWSEHILLDADPTRVITDPCIVAHRTHLLILFLQKSHPDADWTLMAMRSEDTGLTWSKPFALSSPGSEVWAPVVETQNDVLLILWNRFQGNESDIVGRFSLDGGVTWSTERTFKADTQSVATMDAAIDGRDLLLTWSEPFDGQLECYFKRISNAFHNEDLTDIGVDLWLSNNTFVSGDPYALWITLANPDPVSHAEIPLCVMLEAGGQFFFWPSFNDFEVQFVTLQPGITTFEILSEFAWPDIQSQGFARWYAALLTPTLDDLACELSSQLFEWK